MGYTRVCRSNQNQYQINERKINIFDFCSSLSICLSSLSICLSSLSLSLSPPWPHDTATVLKSLSVLDPFFLRVQASKNFLFNSFLFSSGCVDRLYVYKFNSIQFNSIQFISGQFLVSLSPSLSSFIYSTSSLSIPLGAGRNVYFVFCLVLSSFLPPPSSLNEFPFWGVWLFLEQFFFFSLPEFLFIFILYSVSLSVFIFWRVHITCHFILLCTCVFVFVYISIVFFFFFWPSFYLAWLGFTVNCSLSHHPGHIIFPIHVGHYIFRLAISYLHCKTVVTTIKTCFTRQGIYCCSCSTININSTFITTPWYSSST